MTNGEFKQIVSMYEKLVFTICFQMVRDYHEAQNLTQDTFLSAYGNIDKVISENYKPWLARIASNKAKDYLKSAYARKVVCTEENEVFDIKSNELSPDEAFIEKENAEFIKNKIYSLKEPYLKVSELFFIENKTTEEISVKLKRPKKTVQTQILRAKDILKKLLEKEEI